MTVFSMFNNQINAQEPEAHIFTVENRIGKLTWIFAESAASSVIFYNSFKDMYAKSGRLYEYNLDDPSVTEKMFIVMFKELQTDISFAFICNTVNNEQTLFCNIKTGL
jgi:hypothetical protein